MSKAAKATMGLMIITLLSKCLGFVREMVLTYAYGTSMQADAYITALTIPEVLFTAIGLALATTFIPLYNENNSIGGKEKSLYFTNNTINIVTFISFLIAIISILFAEPLVRIFAMEFSGDKLELTVNFARILIPSILFIGLKNIMVSYLQINERFVATGLVGFPYNFIVIIAIILSVKINIYILPVATLIGSFSQFFILYLVSRKCGFKYERKFNIKDEYVKKMILLVGPVFIGVAVNQINVIVDKSLASTLGDGFITALNAANKLNGFVLGLFISTIITVIYPMLSKLSVENNKEKFVETVAKSVNIVIVLIIPITVGAMVLSKPIVQILFQRGAFDAQSTYLTSSALVFYAIGMIGFSIRDVLGKVFYSLQDTKTPMIKGAIAVTLNIILNLALIIPMGHRGLALATSLAAIIEIILLFSSLKKKMGYYGQDKIIKTLVKTLISALIMGIITGILYNSFNFTNGLVGQVFGLGVSVLAGALIYGVLIIIFGVEEIKIITGMLKKKV